ncbi:uncharacterized protein LOC130657022 [Hydractinia symbiolongicarpus]|uniref:uncharacterized protein LOC130657022 n=1 Tax=Hydractinia symbiolongicarpus TaxID=13093 RepID=UPI00254ADCBF|nr:uncharacterized protein LOC130657022 [Hydractinia symbiolongicarpus]
MRRENQHKMIKNFKSITLLYLVLASITVAFEEEKFPWKSFFKKTGISDVDKYLCSSNTTFPRRCKCNENCWAFNKCCIDKLWNETDPIPLHEYLSRFIKRSKLSINQMNRLQNTSILGKSNVFSSISTCTDMSKIKNVQGCLNKNNSTSVEYLVPVEGADGYVYKNIFCANCNNVKSFQFVSINLICLGVDIPTYEDLINHQDCHISVDTANKERYIENRCDNCRNENKKTFELCKAFNGREVNNPDDYKNCRKYVFRLPQRTSTFFPIIKIKNIEDFFISYNKQHDFYLTATKSCYGNKIFDMVKQACVKTFCPLEYTRVDNTCVRKNKISVAANTNPMGTSWTMENISIYIILKKKELDFQIDPQLAKNMIKNYTNLDVNNFIQKEDEIVYTQYRRNMSHSFNITKALSAMPHYDMKIFLTSGTPIYLPVNKTFFPVLRFPNNSLCARPELVEKKKLINFQLYNALQLTNTTGNTSFFISISKEGIFRMEYLCKEFFLKTNCLLTDVTQKFMITSNLTLKIEGEKRFYSPSEYTLIDKSVAVCVNNQNMPPTTQHVNAPPWQATVKDVLFKEFIIGTSISIICYIWLLHKIIKNCSCYVAQQNMAALCFSLLVSDSLFFLHVVQFQRIKNYCWTIAVILHWLFLVTHMLVVVIAYEFLMTFRQKMNVQQSKSNKRFMKYCIFATLLPASLVTILAATDKYHVLQIGYGSVESICWIENMYARLFSYIVPFVSVCFFASGALLIAVRNIQIVKKNCAMAMNGTMNDGNKTAKLALKLIVILGIVEVIGIIQIAKDNLSEKEQIFNAVFQLIYNTLRSFKGLLWLVTAYYTRPRDLQKRFLSRISGRKNSFTLQKPTEQRTKL